jgi:acyl carrier protein
VAYVVSRDPGAASASDLRRFLSSTLPQYMVPSAFVHVASLPLNSNGKLDRAALPDPGPETAIPSTAFRAAATPTEEQVVQIVSGVLGMDGLSLDDNFFLLGLHSLVATQIAARVCDRFGIQLTLRQLFETQTAARLAAEVDRQLIAKLDSLTDEEVAQYLAMTDQDGSGQQVSPYLAG